MAKHGPSCTSTSAAAPCACARVRCATQRPTAVNHRAAAPTSRPAALSRRRASSKPCQPSKLPARRRAHKPPGGRLSALLPTRRRSRGRSQRLALRPGGGHFHGHAGEARRVLHRPPACASQPRRPQCPPPMHRCCRRAPARGRLRAPRFHQTFPLLSDTTGAVSASFGADLNIPIFGRFSDRQTFLINNKSGVVAAKWKEADGSMASVKTPAHTEQILAAIAK